MWNKSHYVPVHFESVTYEIKFVYYGEGKPEEKLPWQEKPIKVLDGQGISSKPRRYSFTKQLLIGDTKVTFTRAIKYLHTQTVDKFNKVYQEPT